MASLAIAFVCALSYWFAPIFYLGMGMLVLLVGVLIYEYVVLRKAVDKVGIDRAVADSLSLHHRHEVKYTLYNESDRNMDFTVIDELPAQLQERKFTHSTGLDAGGTTEYTYAFIPLSRGAYLFDKIHVFCTLPRFSLVQMRKSIEKPAEVRVLPSVYLMKKYAMEVFSKTSHNMGIRKIRRVGESDEFEHLKQYQQGDNIKNINWQATSRMRQLMVNSFQETRSQNIYLMIDKGRTMEMPSDGLSLLDHSINSALVLSNIVLRKYDKVGLLTFSDTVDTFLKASDQKQQLDRVNTFLYNEATSFKEAGYENLYFRVRRQIKNRSIIILYTNFETSTDFERNKSYIELLSKRHLLVVVMFENEEMSRYVEGEAQDVDQIYRHTIATSLVYEKQKIHRQIKALGISCILTKPSELNIATINKYLEIKAKSLS